MALFEREIRFIYDFNLNRVKKIGSYLTFEQLVSADLHPAILQYISAEIDFLIFEDRQKLLKESVFDYSGKNISVLFNQIDDEIKKTKKFSLEYVNKILLHSTSFIVNYLIRPRWTLSQFLFDNEEEKNASEIKQILNYVYYYDYLKDTLISYLDKKRIVSITKNDLETLLAKVDNLGVDSYLPTILESSLKAISEIFNIGSVQTDKFPIQAIELFLMEKDLHTHHQKLKELFPGDPRPKVSVSDVKNILLDIEYNDLSIDPYMEEETIEEDSLSRANSPEFEELPDQYEGDPVEMDEQTKVESEAEIDPDTFISQNFADPEIESVEDEISEKEVEDADSFDQKLDDVHSEIEIIDEPADENKEGSELDIESDEKEIKAVEDSEYQVDENISDQEAIEEEIVEQPAESKSDIQILDEETKITINYPKGYESTEDTDVVGTEKVESTTDSDIEEELSIEDEQQTEDLNIEETLNDLIGPDEAKSQELDELPVTESEASIEPISDLENEESSEAAIEDSFDELVADNVPDVVEEEEITVNEEDNSAVDEILNPNNNTDDAVEKEQEVESNLIPELEEEPELFPKDEVEALDEILDSSEEEEEMETSSRIDISELLENKNMTKIIKVIFDYDMEDFANTIEQISECLVKEEADEILDRLYTANRVKTNSKEVAAFNSIIAEYFGTKG